MSLAITIIIVLVLGLLTLVGFWRDLRRGVLALAGTLLGAIVANFWGERWGIQLSEQLGSSAAILVFAVNTSLLLATTFIVGYGSGALLSRTNERRTPVERIICGLIGLFNGVLLLGYILRYGTADNPGFREVVASSLPAEILHEGLPIMFLAIAVLFTAVVLLRGLANMIGASRTRPAVAPAKPTTPPPTPAPPTGPLPGPQQRQDNQAKALDKINEALKKES